MNENSHHTLRDRLESWPPFLVLALSRVRTKPLSKEEKQARLWNRDARRERNRLKRNGTVLPRKPVWRRVTLEEVEASSKLSTELIRNLSTRETWDGIRIENCLVFMDACGFDLLRIERKTKLMKLQLSNHKAFAHLTTQQMQRFAKSVERWKAGKIIVDGFQKS